MGRDEGRDAGSGVAGTLETRVAEMWTTVWQRCWSQHGRDAGSGMAGVLQKGPGKCYLT